MPFFLMNVTSYGAMPVAISGGRRINALKSPSKIAGGAKPIMARSIFSRANFTCGPMSGPMATILSRLYAIYYGTIPSNNS